MGLDHSAKSSNSLPSNSQEKTLLDLVGEPSLVERLTELGFVPGEKIRFLHQIVWSGPVVVEVRGVSIALRAEEAKCLKT